MTFQQELVIELTKLAVGFLGVTLLGGAFTAFWASRQKQRDVERLELTNFYELYGDFLTAWRLWNTIKKESTVAATGEITRFALLKQASEAEGALEGMLLKLASERRLSLNDQQTLGKFRQACQQIRQSIRDDEMIPWSSSEHPEYLAFKQGASYLASLIPRKLFKRSPSQMATAKLCVKLHRTNITSRRDFSIGSNEDTASPETLSDLKLARCPHSLAPTLVILTLITRTARARASYPSCVAVYPRH